MAVRARTVTLQLTGLDEVTAGRLARKLGARLEHRQLAPNLHAADLTLEVPAAKAAVALRRATDTTAAALRDLDLAVPDVLPGHVHPAR